ncbi:MULTISPECIES: MFS transporter [unclassified Saccharicrinis]|uniref:MFS transporter n=1 Tax=unclassified Saccharicrinis TaxID=2646859 RepID=UPI003D3596CC
MDTTNNKLNYAKLAPVMLAFFAMGFVDLVGIATNYVKADFELSDSVANLLPSMVFFWFLIFSVPTGMLMDRIGRRKTLVLSLFVTILSLMLPVIAYDYTVMLVSFALLGIGNTLMQVSINPLVSNLIRGDRLASTMTFGQFVKAIASFMAPIIAAWAALQFNDWKLLFPIFMVVAIAATLWLGFTKIEEEKVVGKPSTFGQCFSLLGDGFVFLSFLGIMCHVGIDVGTNVTAPKILMERLGMDLSAAGYATSVYFLFRTIGALTGSFILVKFSAKKFFIISVAMLTVGISGLTIATNQWLIYAFVGMIGYGNSNVFSIVFSQALFHKPDKKNEISGLMIMGLFGGTIFPLVMGVASDAMASQIGAIIVMLAGAVYLLSYINKVKY